MNHMVTVDIEDHEAVDGARDNKRPEAQEAMTNREAPPADVHDSTGKGEGDKQKADRDQLILKVGSLVALVSGCLNTTNGMLSAFENGQVQMAIVNAVMLGVFQSPTTLVVMYNLFEAWFVKKVKAFRRAMKDLKIMEEFYSSSMKPQDPEKSSSLDKNHNKDLNFQELHEQLRQEMHINPTDALPTSTIASYHSTDEVTYQEPEPIVLESIHLYSPINAKEIDKTKRTKSSRPSSAQEEASSNMTKKHSPSSKKPQGSSTTSTQISTPRQKSAKKMNPIVKPLPDTNESPANEMEHDIFPNYAKAKERKSSCLCYPINKIKMLRSKSLPDISVKDMSISDPDMSYSERNKNPLHDSDIHINSPDDLSKNISSSVSINNNPKRFRNTNSDALGIQNGSRGRRMLGFPWKKMRRGRSQEHLLSTEGVSENQGMRKNLPSQSSCIPCFQASSRHRKLSVISIESEPEAVGNTDDNGNNDLDIDSMQRRRRLPEAPPPIISTNKHEQSSLDVPAGTRSKILKTKRSRKNYQTLSDSQRKKGKNDSGKTLSWAKENTYHEL